MHCTVNAGMVGRSRIAVGSMISEIAFLPAEDMSVCDGTEATDTRNMNFHTSMFCSGNIITNITNNDSQVINCIHVVNCGCNLSGIFHIM